MPRLAGSTAREIRGLVPAAREAWDQSEADVLNAGVVDQEGHQHHHGENFRAEDSHIVPDI